MAQKVYISLYMGAKRRSFLISWLVIMATQTLCAQAQRRELPDLLLPEVEQNHDFLLMYFSEHRESMFDKDETRTSHAPKHTFGSAFNNVKIIERYRQQGPRSWNDKCKDLGPIKDSQPQPFAHVQTLSQYRARNAILESINDRKSYHLECQRRSPSGHLTEYIFTDLSGRTLHCLIRIFNRDKPYDQDKNDRSMRTIINKLEVMFTAEYLCLEGEPNSGS